MAIRRRFGRRALSVSLLAMYAVTASGLPLPTGNLSKKSGDVFPCMDCPCGCNSAEQCWRACCCHTLAERMDWAREHGILPPEYAIDEARHQGIDLCWLDEPQSLTASKTCSIAGSTSGKRCCCCHRNDHPSTGDAKTSAKIIVWKALACGGQSMNWLAAVPSLIAVRHELADQIPFVSWLGRHNSVCTDGIVDAPVVPPPERV
jgi:hypothetical protein